MVQSKKSGPADTMNGSGKRQSAMPYTRGNMKSHGGMMIRKPLPHVKSTANPPKGNRSSFQTDTGISGGRLGEKRELQRWDAGGSSNGGLDGGLEDTKDNNKPWDQFAVNEEKFGVQTDYDESIYTTSIDRSRPDYNQKVARAEKLARRIEGTTANSAHAAEERIVDHVGGADDGMDEEDKYVDRIENTFALLIPSAGTAVSSAETFLRWRARTRTNTRRRRDVHPLARRL